jgi:hypothetical protein
LAEAAAAQLPTSLYYSMKSVTLRVVIGIGLAAFGYVRYPHAALLWTVVAIVVFGVATTTKRIDLDKNTLTLVPLLPILRKQRLPLRNVGAFRQIGASSYRGFPSPSAQTSTSEPATGTPGSIRPAP